MYHGVHQGSSGTTALAGWEFIQEKILSSDEDMIADYADDIDTLLVFVSRNMLAQTMLTFAIVGRLAFSPLSSRRSLSSPYFYSSRTTHKHPSNCSPSSPPGSAHLQICSPS